MCSRSIIVRRQTPDARRQTPDARRQTPDARRQTPDARPDKSGLFCCPKFHIDLYDKGAPCPCFFTGMVRPFCVS